MANLAIGPKTNVAGLNAHLSLAACAIAIVATFAFGLSTFQPAAASGRENQSQPVNSLQEADLLQSELMLENPVGELPVVDDARWSAKATDNSVIATIWWICLLIVLFAAGLPWTRLVFRESVYVAAHARLITLLAGGYLTWILASLELIRFRAIWSGLALAAVGTIGWLLLRHWRRGDPDTPRCRGLIVAPEIAFWSVFTLFLAFRLINPDSWHPIWGGEKPMEFAHINAILRSAHFPPFDPWFSGGILNYYYYGEYLIAYLMKLSGIPSEVAFNLAQPTLMALLASGVFSVSATLASRMSRRSSRNWVGGAVGVIVVGLMGNLVALRNVLEALPSLPSPSFIDWTWAGSRAIAGGITEFPYFTGLYADLHAHVVALPITVLIVAIGFEIGSRDVSAGGASTRLTAVSMAMPATLAALGLGTLGASNAWDVPLYAVLIAASIVMGFQHIRPFPLAIGASTATIAAVFGAAYLLFKPFHDSFVALFSSVDRVRAGTDLTEFLDHLGGLLVLIALGLAALLIERQDGSETTPASSHLPLVLVSGGAWIALLAAFLELENLSIPTSAVLTASILAIVAATVFILARFDRSRFALLAVTSISATVLFIAWRGWDVLAVTLTIAAVGVLIWFSSSRSAVRYIGLLIAAGGFAAGGVELVYVVDDLESLEDWYRMNTLFKVYNEVWITLGLAASALIGALAIRLAANRANHEPARASDSAQRPSSAPTAIAAAAAAIVAVGLLYPLLATAPRLELRFPGHPGPTTLNALDWMRYGTVQSAAGETVTFDEDLDVINWFNAEVAGSPVIAEAAIGPYRGNGSRISIATGLPAVLGWDRHERQQRYTPPINARIADLNEIYNSTDPERKIELLDRYGVEYVIVGEVERKTIVNASEPRPYASPQGLAAFESMVGDSLEIAFQSGETIVYRVI